MQSDDYQQLLDEYKVICDYHRAEDQLKWQVLGIAYGGAALLATAAMNARYSFASIALAALAAAVTTLGTAVCLRLQQFTRWRLERAWELEDRLGFVHHKHVRERDLESGRKNRIRDVVRLGYSLPWVMWALFVAVTFLKRGVG